MKGAKLIQLVKIVLRCTDHEHHGCLSGDCPHEKQEQCLEALLEECALAVDEERQNAKCSKEWAQACRERRDEAVNMAERLREDLRVTGIGFALALQRWPEGLIAVSEKVERELGEKLFIEMHQDQVTRTRTFRAHRLS
jgi:hypothetical protein